LERTRQPNDADTVWVDTAYGKDHNQRSQSNSKLCYHTE